MLTFSTTDAYADSPGCKLGAVTDEVLQRFTTSRKKVDGKLPETGKKVIALSDTKPGEFYSGVESVWTKTQYRNNLGKLKGSVDLPADVDAHHIFPKDLERKFKAAGVWVHDPRVMVPMHKDLHSVVHSLGYNKEWKGFLSSNPNYDEVISQMSFMAEKYKFDHLL